MASKKAFISTPIYYASGDPHIGHAYTTLLGDALTRYKKMLGYDVFFVTGMDEFGQKIQNLAEKKGITEKEFVDKNCKKFIDLFKKMQIEYDGFSRTTNPKHIKVVQELFNKMYDNDDIYLDIWKGYYCVGCEENYTQSQIEEKDGIKYCKIGHKIIEKNEESYFFKITKYSNWINEYLKNNKDLIFPEHRLNELKNNFLNNLTDLSISRTTTKWGIPIPINDKHRIYVWMDALFNYLSILNYLQNDDENYQKFWNNDEVERIHLMSKEITRFHCIYWPIFLHSLNLKLPTKIFAHGWIVTKEGKMSKSLGNVLDPIELINNYGVDAVRYFFTKEISPIRDGIFSYESFIEVINNDLANNIGNLVNRTISMIKKYNNGVIPKYNGVKNEVDELIETNIKNLINSIPKYVDNLELNLIVDDVIKLVKIANKYIEDFKPWELFKNNDIIVLHSLLNHLCQVIKIVCFILSPILVNGTKEIMKQMNFNNININNCLKFEDIDEIIVNDNYPIYQRFELTDKNNEK